MYDHDQMADVHVGMDDQARAVLHALAAREPTFVDYDVACGGYDFRSCTYGWYNGRERGFSLVVSVPGKWSDFVQKRALIIVVAEGHNHDGIVVDHWLSDRMPFNSPVADDFPEEAYERRWTCPYLRVDQAVQRIFDVCKDQWAEWEAEAEGAGE